MQERMDLIIQLQRDLVILLYQVRQKVEVLGLEQVQHLILKFLHQILIMQMLK